MHACFGKAAAAATGWSALEHDREKRPPQLRAALRWTAGAVQAARSRHVADSPNITATRHIYIYKG
jgi:hypothetical protein